MGLFDSKKEPRTFAFIAQNEGAYGAVDNSKVYDDLLDEFRTLYDEFFIIDFPDFAGGRKPNKEVAKRKFRFSMIEDGRIIPFWPEEWSMGIDFPQEPGFDTNFQVQRAVCEALKEHFDVGSLLGAPSVDVDFPGEKSPLGNYTIFIVKANVDQKS